MILGNRPHEALAPWLLSGAQKGIAISNPVKNWLETSQRRYRELVEGKVKGVPGPLVFDRLRKRLAE